MHNDDLRNSFTVTPSGNGRVCILAQPVGYNQRHPESATSKP